MFIIFFCRNVHLDDSIKLLGLLGGQTMKSTKDACFVPGIFNRPINHKLLNLVFRDFNVES
jgi:hypothetical protein